MTRLSLRLVVSMVAFAFLTGNLPAQAIPQLPTNPFQVYGPAKFERVAGSPATQTVQFSLPWIF